MPELELELAPLPLASKTVLVPGADTTPLAPPPPPPPASPEREEEDEEEREEEEEEEDNSAAGRFRRDEVSEGQAASPHRHGCLGVRVAAKAKPGEDIGATPLDSGAAGGPAG